MKKLILAVLVFIGICGAVRADQEYLSDFSEKNTPLLNEEIRKIKRSLGGIPSSFVETKVVLWYVGGALETGDGKAATVYLPFDGVITKAVAHVNTAPVGHSIDLAIRKSGSDIFSGAFSITAGQTSATSTTFSSSAVTNGDYFNLDIDAIGSSTAGSDLTVELYVAVENPL